MGPRRALLVVVGVRGCGPVRGQPPFTRNETMESRERARASGVPRGGGGKVCREKRRSFGTRGGIPEFGAELGVLSI